MKRTISRKVTIRVVSIVIGIFVIIMAVIGSIVSNKLIERRKAEMQLNSDKYASEINSWINQKRALVEETAKHLTCDGDVSRPNVYKVITAHIKNQEDVLTLYFGKPNKDIIMSNKELEKGIVGVVDPNTRQWYQDAKNTKGTITLDPYQDAFTGEMCTTIATPVYINEKDY